MYGMHSREANLAVVQFWQAGCRHSLGQRSSDLLGLHIMSQQPACHGQIPHVMSHRSRPPPLKKGSSCHFCIIVMQSRQLHAFSRMLMTVIN